MKNLKTHLVMVGVLLASVCGLSWVAVPQASAEPEQVSISVSANADDTHVVVTGSVHTLAGASVSSISLTISLGSVGQATAVTAGDGSYSARFPRPAPATYTVKAAWGGNSLYAASSGSASVIVGVPAKTKTAMSMDISPTEVLPGGVVTISGFVAGGGRPIVSAMVSLTTTYGGLDPIAVTNGDGYFESSMSIPEEEGFPSSFSVTAVFPGDSVYEGSNAKVSGTIQTPPPAPTEEPTEETTSTSTPSAIQTDTAKNKPDAIMSTFGPSDAVALGGEHMVLVEILFLVVAFVAVGTLLILGIISHSKKALERGERRGFGSDFGKEEPSAIH
ncbi:MAG: Ig-like domain-containing protein [Propionibacteriaceae bacterium]|nr:Ig-like domain-containing protein [Propionibacteriaceae bacterium]